MASKISEYKEKLSDLLLGNILPSRIVGKGYKNPKRVAASWLHVQIYNLINPEHKISGGFVSSNGKLFTSTSRAMRSVQYQSLLNNELELFSDVHNIIRFGVLEVTDGGYMVWYTCGVIQKSKCA